jgi:hypothetical protein
MICELEVPDHLTVMDFDLTVKGATHGDDSYRKRSRRLLFSRRILSEKHGSATDNETIYVNVATGQIVLKQPDDVVLSESEEVYLMLFHFADRTLISDAHLLDHLGFRPGERGEKRRSSSESRDVSKRTRH